MKLSRILTRLIFLAIIGMVLSASAVYATPYSIPTHEIKKDDLISFQDWYGYGNGGEFRVFDKDNILLYYSFCVETDEYISFGTKYKIGSITKEAKLGGAGGPEPDPLDPKTAYLFYNFSMGTLLTPYNYGSGVNIGHESDAQSLQRAIWFIEQELVGITEAQLQTLDPKAYNYYIEAKNAGWSDTGNVWVLNVVDKDTGAFKQDQLVLVPEPGILILLGIAMSAIGVASWRISKI